MTDISEERCEKLAHYMLEHHATVRSAAAYFGISKSTVHKDVTTILETRNGALYAEIKDLLETNKAERHFRGGEATRRKYLLKKQKKQL